MGGRVYAVTRDNDCRPAWNIHVRPIPKALEGEVLIRVSYSSLAFKDALIFSSPSLLGVDTETILGTDAFGVVIDSSSSMFRAGDEVMVVSANLGVSGVGGLAEYLAIEEQSVFRVPEKWTLHHAASIGIPGFTAALAVHRIWARFSDAPHSIAISGACGAVGGFAIELASRLGAERIFALSSRASCFKTLQDLGATRVFDSLSFQAEHETRLLPERWTAAIDTLGGQVLGNLLKSMKRSGYLVSVGIAVSDRANLDLAPFVLRSVGLQGVNLESEFSAEMDQLVRILDSAFPSRMLQHGVSTWDVSEVPTVFDRLTSRQLMLRHVLQIN